MMSSFLISAVSGLILGLMLFIFPCALGIMLVHKLFFGKDKVELSELSLDERALQISGTVSFLFSALSGLMILIVHIYKFQLDTTSHTDYADATVSALRSAYLLFNAFGFIATYFFLVCRLYATFKGSIYSINTTTISIHIGIGILTVFIGLMSFVLVMVNVNRFIINLLFAACGLLPICTLIQLIYAFNHRLFQIVYQQRQILATKKLPETQIKLMGTVRRHTIIGVIIILLSFLLLVIYFIAILVTNGEYAIVSSYPNAEAYRLIFDVFNVLAFSLGALAIYLGFTVNHKLYAKLCSACDRKCGCLCEQLVQSKAGEHTAESPVPNQSPSMSAISTTTATTNFEF